MSYASCIRAVAQAAGRALSDDEVRRIYERVHKAALDIKAGRAAPDEVGLGKKLQKELGTGQAADQIVQQAAERAAAELEHEALQQERQAHLQLVRMGGVLSGYSRLVKAGVKPLDAASMVIFRNYKGVNIASLEQHAHGVRSELLRQLQPTWDAMGERFLGLLSDEKQQMDLIRELRSEPSGNAQAKEGARHFHEVSEKARKWFNDAGGDVGTLDDWGKPQHHSQAKVARAAHVLGRGDSADPAANRAAYVEHMLPILKRTQAQGKYYRDEPGAPWTEERLREFIGRAHDTIATDGMANAAPGEFAGPGKRASRHAEHRQIHFPDAEAEMAYWRQFGEKSLLEILYGHVDRMARDIGFIEFMGPNDRTTYQALRDTALKDAVGENRRLTPKLKGQAARLDSYYEHASGRSAPSVRPGFSSAMDGIAHLNTAGKGGGFTIASLFGDRPIYQAVSHLNNLPLFQDWQTQLSLLNPANAADRRALQRQGLMLDAVRNGLTRFWGDFGTSSSFSSFTGKLANAVMRSTGMSAINEIPKAAFGAGLFDAIGGEIRAGKKFTDLPDSDVRTLKNYGITEADWNVWRIAQLEDLGHGSGAALTPDAISRIADADLQRAGLVPAGQGPETAAQAARLRRDATVKLLGAVNTEADFAIVTPGWKERAQFYSRLQRGEAVGEIGRAVLQFKAFPWAQLQRGLDLIANMDGPVSKGVMAAYLISTLTLSGAMIVQTREMLSGKDPRAMIDEDWMKFWGQAFFQGGALGIYGDFLYSVNQTRYGSGPLEIMAGPTVGPLLELGVVQPLGALAKLKEGKETRFLAQEVQDLKGFVPGGNLWYAKAALDNAVWANVLDWLSPGYINSVRQRTMRDFHQDRWWEPGEMSPERAPALGEAIRR